MIADPPPPPHPPLLPTTPYRRDRQRRPSSEYDNHTSLSTVMTTESESQRGRRRSSIAPPLGDLHINNDLASQTKSTEPLMMEDSAPDRGLKRRRRSSAFDRCDEMRRMSLKRCNGSGGLIEKVDDIHYRQGEQPQPAHEDSSCQLMTTNEATDVSSSSTSISYSSSSASASTSSLVHELNATSLSAPLVASDTSSPVGQSGPVKQLRQLPVFTCPFTPYAQDRREHPHAMHGFEDRTLDVDRGDRRNSSISSQYTRRDSGWSTTESGRGTMTSGVSSPAASTMQEWKPFPVDKLPRDIINLILDHVLGSPEFGQNGRWKDKRGQEEDKVQMVKALKVSASIHLKFALIHRSWTPHVIKSMYRFPRLTSKDAIEKFSWAIANPLSLWGSETVEDGQIGGPIGHRGRFVRLITYCVGRGRHSATDYLMWSGTWFATAAGAVLANLPNARGWECEGWCSKGCEETRELEVFNYPEAARYELRHLSILRSPLPADILVWTLAQTKDMRALELLDVQKHFVTGDTLELLKSGLRMANQIEIFAMKVEGGVEQEGPLDDALSVMPTLRHLSMQADLLSLKFFAAERTPDLQSMLIGMATRPPVLFHGKQALDALWAEGQAEAIYSRARQQAQFVFAEGTTFEGSVTHRMTLNSTTISINRGSSGGARPPSFPGMNSHESLSLDPSSTSSEPSSLPHRMVSSSSTPQPQLGLEAWLIKELNNPHSALSRESLTGDDALAVYDSYTHQTPI